MIKIDINEILDSRYKIISLIGKGGTSSVYKAINLRLGSEWAIKEINKSNSENFDLYVEPNLLKNLQHQSLPRIVDIVEEEEAIYIIEDYIEGTSLERLIKQVNCFPEEKVLSWAKQLCEVLDYLHSQKPNPIIYRDMKPANIMLDKNGQIKLIDFGIAREYKEDVELDTVIMGTKGYAAPEQYGKHQTDERSDIYSLGVTIYNLLTGKSPNEPPFEIVPVRRINPKLSEGIEHIIIKATKSNPEERYRDIKELIFDLNNIEKLSGEYKKRQSKIRNTLISYTGGLVVSLGIIVYGAKTIVDYKIAEYLDNVSIAVSTAKNIGLEEGIPLFEKAINSREKRNEGYLELAKAYIDEMDYNSALTFLQKDALTKNKEIRNVEEYKYLIGVCLFSKGDYVGANEYFSKISGEDFSEYEFYKTVSSILSSPEGIKDGDEIVKTIEGLNNTLEHSKDEEFKARGYVTISDIYRDNPLVFKDGEEKQIEILEKAISKGGNNKILYERLAQAYYQKGVLLMGEGSEFSNLMNKSLDNYNILLKLGYETSSIYRNMGVIHKQLGNIAKAKELFNTLIEKYPKDFKGYVELAYINVEEKNKAEALRNYEIAKKNNNIENNIELSRLEILINEMQG